MLFSTIVALACAVHVVLKPKGISQSACATNKGRGRRSPEDAASRATLRLGRKEVTKVHMASGRTLTQNGSTGKGERSAATQRFREGTMITAP